MAKKFVLTGKWHLSRTEITTKLEHQGHVVSTKVSKQTDVLLFNDLTVDTKKIQQAIQFGATIMTYEKYFEKQPTIISPHNSPVPRRTRWIAPHKYFALMQSKRIHGDPQMYWNDSTVELIIQLKPILMFFEENGFKPSENDWKGKLKEFQPKDHEFRLHREYLMDYKYEFTRHATFSRRGNENIDVELLNVRWNENFSYDWMCELEDYVKDQNREYFYQEYSIEIDELTDISEFDEDMKIRAQEISDFSIQIPDNALYGYWTYYNLEFYQDKAGKYYVEFKYYDDEDEQTLTVFAPIDAEVLGKVLWCANQCEEEFHYFMIIP